MRAFLIVEVQPRSNPRLRLGNRSIGVQVYLFVFQAPPEPLHEDIIHAPALAADLDLALLQHANKVIAGELAALIGVEDLGPSEPSDRKSTRLNSSHANISNAVFCLKKKKHTSELQSRQ